MIANYKLIIAAMLVLLFGYAAFGFFYEALTRPPVKGHDETINLNNGMQVLVPAGWHVASGYHFSQMVLSRIDYGPPFWRANEKAIAIVNFFHFAGPEAAQNFYDNYFSSPELFEQEQLDVIQASNLREVLEYETRFLQINGQRAISFKFVTKNRFSSRPNIEHEWIVLYYVPGVGLEVRCYLPNFMGQNPHWPETEPVFRRIIESVVLPKGDNSNKPRPG